MIDPILVAICAGILGGICRGVLGFFQANGDDFDTKKLGRSVLIAIVLGIVAGISMPDLGFIATFTAVFAGTVAIENIGIGTFTRMNEEKKKK